ncbi:MAG: universal stress protein [Altererythrobacter sp.]|nr:universal stress protein [Altererythrobacter sp.]
MKSILLHVEDDEGMEARLQVAMDIARAHGSHITCLQVVSYEIFAPGDFYGSAMMAVIPQLKEAAGNFRKKIETDLANEDVQWEWQCYDGVATSKLLERSALNDLIVVGPRDVGQRVQAPSSMIAELALRTSVQVLVVPPETERLDPEAPILVAWNNSSEACAALRASVPLLRKSSKVFLAIISEEKDRDRHDFPPVEGAQYLSRYGVHAEVLDIPRDGAHVSDALFAAAKARDCGLVVMGAYGHSRLAEFLLGGVTRKSLSEPQLPILLAH